MRPQRKGTQQVQLDVTVRKIPTVEITALLNYMGNTGSLRTVLEQHVTVLEQHVTLVETEPCV